MSTKQVQDGKFLQVTAGGVVAVGSVQEVNGAIGVAQGAAAASGDLYSLALTGVHTVAKKTGTAWVIGEPLWWDTSAVTASNVYVAAAADKFMGYAFAAAASGDTTGNCLFFGDFVPAAPAVAVRGQAATAAAATVVVTVGTAYNGKVVFASMLTSDANVSIRSAAVAAGDLTITLTGSATAKVYYQIIDSAVA